MKNFHLGIFILLLSFCTLYSCEFTDASVELSQDQIGKLEQESANSPNVVYRGSTSSCDVDFPCDTYDFACEPPSNVEYCPRTVVLRVEGLDALRASQNPTPSNPNLAKLDFKHNINTCDCGSDIYNDGDYTFQIFAVCDGQTSYDVLLEDAGFSPLGVKVQYRVHDYNCTDELPYTHGCNINYASHPNEAQFIVEKCSYGFRKQIPWSECVVADDEDM